MNSLLSSQLSGSNTVFLLGMVTTRANHQGALVGVLSSVLIAVYLLVAQTQCPNTKLA